MEQDFSKYIHDEIKKIVYQVLQNENLLTNTWRFGKVDSVISPTQLKVFIDGSSISVEVPCTPSVTFGANDEVWVVLTSRDNKSKYVIDKRY